MRAQLSIEIMFSMLLAILLSVLLLSSLSHINIAAYEQQIASDAKLSETYLAWIEGTCNGCVVR